MLRLVQLIGGFFFLVLWVGALEQGETVLFTVATIYSLLCLLLMSPQILSSLVRPRGLY